MLVTDKSSGRTVLIIMALVGIAAFGVPSIVEMGFSRQTLWSISVNFGIGILAAVLVTTLFQWIRTRPSTVCNLDELAELVEKQPGVTSRQVAKGLRQALELAKNLEAVGVERVFPTRESAYSAIATDMRHARSIHISTGCLHSFWSMYREIILERDKDPDCDVKVALLSPDSQHLATRTAMDSCFQIGQEMLPGYVATIREIHSELGFCRFYDFCPPASTWVIDDKIYITPYLYGIRGGQGLCLQIGPSESSVFEKIKQSAETIIHDSDS